MRILFAAAVGAIACCGIARATIVTFFDPAHPNGAQLVASGDTWDTYLIDGYMFRVTRDKLFTGGTGQPIGRDVHIDLPEGLEAQALTELPPGQTDHKGKMEIWREDGAVFDLNAFGMTLVWWQLDPITTYFEIMPILNGEDGFNDPFLFNGTGHQGDVFYYDQNTVPSTAPLAGFDRYQIKYLLDFAMTGLVLDGPGGCNAADIAQPWGTLDLADINAFASGFLASDPAADLAAPFGVFDLADINAFVTAFLGGCP
ncbi:MAG: hypothetical protein H6810_10690 [Phycisphaeraceae bacterium]|nr:MAG: hypothetical protein H6810_10690 [Phycisphaeraceae bacterium]